MLDMHVHCGPEPIPRKYDVFGYERLAELSDCGMVLKSHFTPTWVWTELVDSDKLISSITLNWFVGGINARAVELAARQGARVVWFPTIHSTAHLETMGYDIPPEWVGTDRFSTPSTEIQPIRLRDFERETDEIISIAVENKLVLATAHLSAKDVKWLVPRAIKEDARMVVTHPLYKPISLSITDQRELAKLGAKMEYCFAQTTIDKLPMSLLIDAIKKVGPENCIASSDLGQPFSIDPPTGLAKLLDAVKKSLGAAAAETLASNAEELLA